MTRRNKHFSKNRKWLLLYKPYWEHQWHMNNKVTFSEVLIHLLWLHAVNVYREVWKVGFIRTITDTKLTQRKWLSMQYHQSSWHKLQNVFNGVFTIHTYLTTKWAPSQHLLYNKQWVVSQNTHYKTTAVYGGFRNKWDPVSKHFSI
jgi:hypothetical protein